MPAVRSTNSIRILMSSSAILLTTSTVIAFSSNAFAASAYVEACKTYCPNSTDDKQTLTCMEEVEKAKGKDKTFKSSKCFAEHQKHDDGKDDD